MTEVAHEGTPVTGLKAELADEIAAKRALVVVGTGVSLAATGGNDLASWKGLIASGIKRCVEINLCKPTWAASQKGLLESDLDDLLCVAEQVSRRLGWEPTEPCGSEWNKWLRKTAGALRASQPELIQAIRDLDAQIATLNYDNLLTEVTGRRPITWKNAERWLPVLQGNDEAILHLHGHWDQPSSVVLGIRSYDAVMGKELAQHLQRVLASLHSLVFIGCSSTVQDPNFSALVDWMRDQLHGAEHSHYLLVCESEPLPVEGSMLRSAGIVPLYYGTEHADLLPFIRDLAPVGGVTREKPIRLVAQTEAQQRAETRELLRSTAHEATAKFPHDVVVSSRSRFLDALDSSRFASQSDSACYLLRDLYVRAQFFLALLSGDSIVITENQLFDSSGFLDTFYELYRAADAAGLAARIPIKVALRSDNNVFRVVATHIRNDRYVLSLWRTLNSDMVRRGQWADAIGRATRPSASIVLDHEHISLDKLWVALQYFTPDRCVPSQNMPADFSTRLKRITTLSDHDIKAMYTGWNTNGQTLISTRRYLATDEEAGAAREISSALAEMREAAGDLRSRSLIRLSLGEYDNEQLRDGIVELTDCIYNQTLGIGTGADFVQISTLPSQVAASRYINAAYALATYVQDTYNSPNVYVPWKTFAYDLFENVQGLSDHRFEHHYILALKSVRENAPWNSLFKIQANQAWGDSVQNVRRILSRVQTIDRSLFEGVLGRERRLALERERNDIDKNMALEKIWEEHVRGVATAVNNGYWTVGPSKITFSHPGSEWEIAISYSFLKTKRDMDDDTGYRLWKTHPSFKGRLDEQVHSAT